METHHAKNSIPRASPLAAILLAQRVPAFMASLATAPLFSIVVALLMYACGTPCELLPLCKEALISTIISMHMEKWRTDEYT
jgi:hypothetical protein